MKGRRTVDPETGLTANQEAFCVELARTGDASGAYRKAYRAEGMSQNAIAVEAFKLQSNPKITQRLSVLRSDVRRASGITLQEHLETLRSLRDEARGALQLSAAITAEVSRGKVSGLYTDGNADDDAPPVQRVEIIVRDGRKPA